MYKWTCSFQNCVVQEPTVLFLSLKKLKNKWEFHKSFGNVYTSRIQNVVFSSQILLTRFNHPLPTAVLRYQNNNNNSNNDNDDDHYVFIFVASTKRTHCLCSPLPQKRQTGLWEEHLVRRVISALPFQYMTADQAQEEKQYKTRNKTKQNRIHL